ncbi:hypothetical protein LINPERHAP1_LOCUS5807 [Linum perenne]
MNVRLETRNTIEAHLKIHGILTNYTFWFHHGERVVEDGGSISEDDLRDNYDPMHELISDLHPNIDNSTDEEVDLDYDGEPNEEAKKFYRLLDESEKPLFTGCKSSKLSVLVKLLHIKTLGNWSNESFTMLLKMLKQDILPNASSLPDSYYESKKLIRDLGLSYNKIDACDNSCMLYWKEDKHLDSCRVCNKSRWKSDANSGSFTRQTEKDIPIKHYDTFH